LGVRASPGTEAARRCRPDIDPKSQRPPGLPTHFSHHIMDVQTAGFSA